MARIEKLTPNQEALMGVVRGEWLDFVFKSKQPLDEATTKSSVDFLYRQANLEPPRVIIYDSPMACQLALNNLVNEQLYIPRNGKVRDDVYGKVCREIYDHVYDQARDQLYNKASNQVKDQVYYQVRDQVYGQVHDQICRQINSQTYDQVREQKLKYFAPARCDVLWIAGWLSFYDYFNRLGVINHPALNKYIIYARSGVFYSIFRKDFAILCNRPVYIKRDEGHWLHADGAPAILWRDGWSQYYLHGVRVPADYALTPAEKITPKIILAEKNADIQRELIRKVGAERLLLEMGAKDVDEWEDPNTGFKYKLVDMVIGDNIRRRYLYFQHASLAGVFYAKPVPPEATKAFHARAWILSLVERDELDHITIGKEAEIIANLPTRVS